jgi:intracellular multiplication protein IcmL
MKQVMLCFAQARAAVIVDTKLISGALAYRIQFPILQTCQNSQQASTQKMILTALSSGPMKRGPSRRHRDRPVAEAR